MLDVSQHVQRQTRCLPRSSSIHPHQDARLVSGWIAGADASCRTRRSIATQRAQQQIHLVFVSSLHQTMPLLERRNQSTTCACARQHYPVISLSFLTIFSLMSMGSISASKCSAMSENACSVSGRVQPCSFFSDSSTLRRKSHEFSSGDGWLSLHARQELHRLHAI